MIGPQPDGQVKLQRHTEFPRDQRQASLIDARCALAAPTNLRSIHSSASTILARLPKRSCIHVHLFAPPHDSVGITMVADAVSSLHSRSYGGRSVRGPATTTKRRLCWDKVASAVCIILYLRGTRVRGKVMARHVCIALRGLRDSGGWLSLSPLRASEEEALGISPSKRRRGERIPR